MASIFSLDAAKKLHIQVGDFKLALAGSAALDRSKKSATAMAAAVEEIEKQGAKIFDGLKAAEAKQLRDAIVSALPEMERLGAKADKIKTIQTAFTYVKASGAAVDTVMGDLVANPLIRKLHTAEDLAKKFSIGAEELSKVDTFIAAKEKLAGLVKSEGSAEQIKRIFVDAHDAPKEVRGALIADNEKLAKLAKNVADDINGGVKKVVDAAGGLAEIEKQILAVEARDISEKDSLKAIKALEKKKEPFIKAIKEATAEGKVHAEKVMELVEKDHGELFETAKAAHKDLGAHMDSVLKAANATADKGRGFLKKLFEFKRSGAFLEELAAKEKTSVAKIIEKHGAEGSVRWGKVGAGVAVVGAAVYAAASIFGNKDKDQPGKYVEAEMQRRSAADQAKGASLA